MVISKNDKTVRVLLWFVPILLAFHNIEEALTMPSWVTIHLSMLQSRYFFFRFVSFSSLQIYISLILVTVVPFLLAWMCLKAPITKRRAVVMLTLQSIVGWNAVVPHLSGVILLGMYNPGTVSALMCNLPFTIYLMRKSVAEGMISRVESGRIVLAGFIVYIPLVYINHLFAQTIAGLIG